MITSEYPTADRPHTVPFITRQVDYLQRAGVSVDVFHFKGAKSPFNYAKAWFRLRKHVAGKEFDLVHAQWGQSALLAMPKRLPLVITFRGNDLEGIVGKDGTITFLGKIQKSVSRLMARLADEIIVVSERLADQLRRSDFHVIPSGLDLEAFRPIPKRAARDFLGLPPERKLVLFAASTMSNPRKRFWLAKDAVDRLPVSLKAELVVANNVPHTQIPYYMNACDALLLTSVHEGSPNVVKEALACDLPVVSVDVGDVGKRIGGIDGCCLCPEATAQAIAVGLERVLRRKARIEGRETVTELHEELIASQVIDVYRSALVKSSKRERITLDPESQARTASHI